MYDMPDLVNQGSAFILKKLILYFFDGDREVLQTYPAIWPFLNRGDYQALHSNSSYYTPYKTT